MYIKYRNQESGHSKKVTGISENSDLRNSFLSLSDSEAWILTSVTIHKAIYVKQEKLEQVALW